MSMIKSEHIFKPEEYLKLVTGESLFLPISDDNEVDTVEKVLEKKGYGHLWSYAFTEIEYIVENELPVVLVACQIYNNTTKEYDTVLRWFDVEEDE